MTGTDTMTAAQATLLAVRGCVADAAQLIQAGVERGSLTQDQASNLLGSVARFPQAQLPPDHQVFGIVKDSVITSLHFQPQDDRGQAREAFRQAVRWIEIETSSQCNRHCDYCPNCTVERRRSNDFLDFGLYGRTIAELAEIDYDGTISFVGNNEFFLHEENRAYVDAARGVLPRAVLKLYSNGDFLGKADLAWAASAGVDLIHVTLHTAPGKAYDDSEALRRIWLFQKQTGLQLQLLEFVKDGKLAFIAQCGRTKVFVKAQNMQQFGHNWNGLVACGGAAARLPADPCSYPLRQFIVTHDGDLLLCCMMFKERTAENDRSGAMIGNLAAYSSVFAAYASPRMAIWRRAIFSTAAKPAPCATCPGFEPDEAKAAPLADQVHAVLALREQQTAQVIPISAEAT